MGRYEHSRSSTVSTVSTVASVHDSFVQLRQSAQAPLAAAVRQRATRNKRFSLGKLPHNRLPELSPVVPARSSSVPPAASVQHFPPAPTDADRAELESRMSRLTYVSGLSAVSGGGDGLPVMGQNVAARPWRGRIPKPPKRIDWGPKQLRDLIASQEVELANMKSALDLSIQMEDAWRRRAEATVTEYDKPPEADEALASQKMNTLVCELQKMRDAMSTLLPNPFRGQMSSIFDDVDTEDGSISGILQFLTVVFKGIQRQRGLLRKRQKQLQIIRDPGASSSSSRDPAHDPTASNSTAKKEAETRAAEVHARAMVDIKMVEQIAELKREVHGLKKKLEAARDDERLVRQHEKVIVMLKAQVKQWETEGRTMIERQRVREHEAAVQRKEVDQAMAERDAMEHELGNAPKIIEKQQRLLSKRDERIKDLEDEAQTLRLMLRSRAPAKALVEAEVQVDIANGELQTGLGSGEPEHESPAMPIPVA